MHTVSPAYDFLKIDFFFCFNFENLRAKLAKEDYKNVGRINIVMVLS